MAKENRASQERLSPFDLEQRNLFVIARHQPGKQPVFSDSFLRKLNHPNKPTSPSNPAEHAYIARIVQSEDLCTRFRLRKVGSTEKADLSVVVISTSKLDAWLEEVRAIWARYTPPSTDEEFSPHDRHGASRYGKGKKRPVSYVR